MASTKIWLQKGEALNPTAYSYGDLVINKDGSLKVVDEAGVLHELANEQGLADQVDIIEETLTKKADLDENGLILASQLPSYVDDVVEYANLEAFPGTGESGKVYVALDTNKTYRWSGSTYVVIGNDLALGETASTAYPGDKGAANAAAIAENAADIATNAGAIATNAGGIATNLAAINQNKADIKTHGEAIEAVEGAVEVLQGEMDAVEGVAAGNTESINKIVAGTTQVGDAAKLGGIEAAKYVTEDELAAELGDYVTSEALGTQLEGYVTDGELTTELGKYVTSEALGTQLGSYVTETELGTELESYVTNEALGTQLGSYVTETELGTELEGYVTDEEFSTGISDLIAVAEF